MLGYCSRCCKHFSVSSQTKSWASMTKVPKRRGIRARSSMPSMRSRGDRVRESYSHGKIMSAVYCPRLTTHNQRQTDTHTYIHTLDAPWRTINRATCSSTQTQTHTSLSNYKTQDTQTWSFIPPMWEGVTRVHDITICSLRPTNGWQEL